MATQNEKILSLAILNVLNHITGSKELSPKDIDSFKIEVCKILSEETEKESVKDKGKIEQNSYIHLGWMDEKTVKREDLHSKCNGVLDIACFRGQECLCVLYLTDDLTTILQPIMSDEGSLLGFAPCGRSNVGEIKVLSQWIKKEVDNWADEKKSWKNNYVSFNQSMKFAPIPVPDREDPFYLPDGTIFTKPE